MNVAASGLINALSVALSYPSEGLAEALKPLRACADDKACAKYAAELRAVLKHADAFTAEGVEQPVGAEAAQLEYTRLFIGSFKMYAPPYASYYVDGEAQVQGPIAMEVAELYRQFGLQLDENERDCADHLHYLLAFACLLAKSYEERGNEEYAEAYRDFCDIYILNWLPDFKSLVDAHAQFPFYPAVVELLANVLQEEKSDD